MLLLSINNGLEQPELKPQEPDKRTPTTTADAIEHSQICGLDGR
jgi:hypothetical protein